MGNASAKSKYHNSHKYTSQYSLSDLIGGSCVGLAQSSNGNAKPWSHASHRSWSEGTLCDKLGSSKTLWPVSRMQSMFLPEFQIKHISQPDDYIFMNVIQKGAFGKVYKIKQRNSGQLFALKVISKAKIIAESGVMQAKQEVAIQKLVGHHPFILNCCYKWQGRRKLYIMTDYVSGGELFSLMDYGCLPENVVRIYVAEVAIAIDFLHDAGVVHRDIKATNILLDGKGHAVLIDFGLAKWLTHSERTNTMCGTTGYMAPEILKGTYYGQEVDWWSLGVLCYFLLLNEYPYDETSNLAQEDGGLGYTPPGLLSNEAESLSPAAKDLLKRLLQPDPRLRLRSVRALQKIAFYLGRDLQSYLLKKESPFELLGMTADSQAEPMTHDFSDFDSAVESSFLHADC